MAEYDKRASWTVTATADNAAATSTKTGVAGRSFYVTGVAGSFAGAAAGKLMTLKDGSTVIGNWYVTNQFSEAFENPIKITKGADAVLSLAASGTGGMNGATTLVGYTGE